MNNNCGCGNIPRMWRVKWNQFTHLCMSNYYVAVCPWCLIRARGKQLTIMKIEKTNEKINKLHLLSPPYGLKSGTLKIHNLCCFENSQPTMSKSDAHSSELCSCVRFFGNQHESILHFPRISIYFNFSANFFALMMLILRRRICGCFMNEALWVEKIYLIRLNTQEVFKEFQEFFFIIFF